MGRSQRVSLSDTRRIHRILDEARELRKNAYAARRHIAFELCRLMNARQAYYVCFDGFTPRDVLNVRDMVIGGWPDQQMLRAWQTWGTRNMLREDPLVHNPTYLPHQRVTAGRTELASDRGWKSSVVYESLAGPAGLGDVVVTYFRRREPGRITGFSIQRGEEEPPFTARDRQLARLFNDEFYRRYLAGAAEAAPVYEAPSPLLSPRQRQALELLLSGAGAKQAAASLGMSPRTFEEHAQMLYRRFNVQDRHELMAHFVMPARPPRHVPA